MEHGNAEPARERANVSRNQNVMYVLPYDSAAIAQFMGPVLEHLAALEPADESGRGPRAIVVTPDAEGAIAIARWIASQSSNAASAIAATGASRSARLIAAHPAPLIVGPPDQLLELVRRAALKLDDVRAVVIAWADVLVDAGAVPSLEALMGEMPKESARSIVAARTTPEVEALVEQYARRPRRVGAVPADAVEPLAVRYVVTGHATRGAALRQLLDALDPPGAAIYVRSDDSERDVRDTLRPLGYRGDDIVRIVRESTPSAALVILYDLPSSRTELEALAASAPNQVVALVQPKQLTALAALAGSERLSPFSLDASLAAARATDQRTRDELRAVLELGLPARELLTLEPLIGDFDAASVA
ncbi:MAG TPA: DEAD/DEAH box helicase, partial [Gemmatimonadaceae bacterium]|nr:DEAD/DEAH box helicase [Gemmatimonadaceae bacterium]